MSKEPTHTTLQEAFIAVLHEVGNPAKSHTATVPTKSGGTFKYTYASLDDTLAIIKEACSAHGVAMFQPCVSDGVSIGVDTMLVGYGEQMHLGTLTMPVSPDPQKNGGIVTYLRRYGASSAFGVVAEEDIDANASLPTKSEPKREAQSFVEKVEAKRVELLDPGAFVMPSGPNKDKTISEIVASDPSWCDKVLASERTSATIRSAVEAYVAAIKAAKLDLGGETIPF